MYRAKRVVNSQSQYANEHNGGRACRTINDRLQHRETIGAHSGRRSGGRPLAAHVSGLPGVEIAAEEASFLRWLDENGGAGKRSGHNWMRNDVRLVRLGYVKARKESSE